MSAEARVVIAHEADIVSARQHGRAMALEAGFTGSEPTMIATAISELARNILVYATTGVIAIELVRRLGSVGIRVVATDHGPGIANLTRAMEDGFSTGGSLGLGLPGARRLMDDFQIDSRLGEGTTVRMAKWRP